MDSEETMKPATTEDKPAAKPRTPRKAAPRKNKEQAAAPAAESTPAPKPTRKPRTGKKAATPAQDKPAEAAAAQEATPAPRKTRTPKNKEAKQEPKADTPRQEPQPAPVQPTVQQTPQAPVEPKAATPGHRQEPQASPKHRPQQQPQHEQLPRISEEQKFDIEFETRNFSAPEPAPGFAVPETVGGGEGNSGSKNRRKRRRNRNRNRDNEQNQQQPRFTTDIDPDELVRRAWKIYLGEVTEEGLALMDDRTATEASRRAFRVAELFLTEAARHRRPATPPTPEIDLIIEEDGLEEF
ncbi:MAG: hypothetical protein E7030_05785 [Akkermansiaceae bacterium]|nr:hypothetical protein [Akkermansiaceae bacterium]